MQEVTVTLKAKDLITVLGLVRDRQNELTIEAIEKNAGTSEWNFVSDLGAIGDKVTDALITADAL